MTITKYEHACVVLEEQGKQLVIDPGVYTSSLPALDNVVGIIITHIHQDHLDKTKIQEILSNNPQAKIYSVQEVADGLKDSGLKVQVVADGSKADVEYFKLEFLGKDHALIHKSLPINQNVGVMINDVLYYPGDSFTLPARPVEILAVPSSAPWMTVGDGMDFILAVKAKKAFATHNALLSEAGHNVNNNMLEMAAKQVQTDYMFLRPGESIEV
jgi:L-ascorbate metabolism protein UlaG (beta-lactamase superfamily)